MPNEIVRRDNFSGGETDPAIQERLDSAKRRAGMIRAQNVIPAYPGTAEKRPGTRYASRAGRYVADSAPRLIPWTGSQTEQDLAIIFRRVGDGDNADAFWGVINARGEWVWGAPADGPTDAAPIQSSRNREGTKTSLRSSPYKWEHVWPRGDTEHGIKFAQSEDVMTLCHPNYPPQELRREVTDGTESWILEPVQFEVSMPSVNGIRITDYRPRTNEQGWNPRAGQEPVDFAVCAFSEELGEGLPGLAAGDGRMLDVNRDRALFLARSTAFVEVSEDQELTYNTQGSDRPAVIAGYPSSAARVAIVQVLGFDKFVDDPSLHVRVNTMNGMRVGDPAFFGYMSGTKGLRSRVFQIRRVVAVKGKPNDSRVTMFPPSGGVGGFRNASYDYDGPWVVLEPDPGPDAIRDLLASRVGDANIVGPLIVGDPTAEGDQTESLPLYQQED